MAESTKLISNSAAEWFDHERDVASLEHADDVSTLDWTQKRYVYFTLLLGCPQIWPFCAALKPMFYILLLIKTTTKQ